MLISIFCAVAPAWKVVEMAVMKRGFESIVECSNKIRQHHYLQRECNAELCHNQCCAKCFDT
eukprot:2925316-Ditylum_brightwellii.AAC.1